MSDKFTDGGEKRTEELGALVMNMYVPTVVIRTVDDLSIRTEATRSISHAK